MKNLNKISYLEIKNYFKKNNLVFSSNLSDDEIFISLNSIVNANVNDLTSQDLLRLQNEGFVSIYSKYWRWWPVIKRHGIVGLILTFYRMGGMVLEKIKHNYNGESKHPLLK